VAKALKGTGAETVRWDLSDLYASPTDPAIEAALGHALERARAFETAYKGRVGSLGRPSSRR
jgi:oligoendopeptidase F